MAYTRNPTWRDWPDKSTPVTADKLEHIETGITSAASTADSALAAAANAQATADAASSGGGVVDNGDGTLSALASITDNGDGTISAP